MGKRTITQEQLQFYYPQHAIKWGHGKRSKHYFDTIATKKLIKNFSEGMSNVDNMYNIIKDLNFIHTKAFIPKHTNLCPYASLSSANLNNEFIKETIGSNSILVSTSLEDSSLEVKYNFKEYFKDKKNVNIDNFTFEDDMFKYEFDISDESYKAVDYVDEVKKRVIAPAKLSDPIKPTDPSLPPDPNAEKPKEIKPMAIILPALPSKVKLSDLGVYFDIDNAVENILLKPLRDELKEKYNVDYYNEDDLVIEAELVDNVLKTNADNTFDIEMSASYTWKGNVFTFQEFYEQVTSEGNYTSESGSVNNILRGMLKKEYNKIDPNSKEGLEKIGKYIQINVIVHNVPLEIHKAYNDLDDNDVYVRYFDGNKKEQLIKITRPQSKKGTKTDIQLSAVYPLKGGSLRYNKPKGETRQERLYRLALEQAGYKNKYKKHYSKKEKEQIDSVTSLANENKVKYADVYQVINLLPALVKANRSNKHWARYFKAVIKYLDKAVGGFPESVSGKTEYYYERVFRTEYEEAKDKSKYKVIGYEKVCGERRCRTVPIYGKRAGIKSFGFDNDIPTLNMSLKKRNISIKVQGIKRVVRRSSFNKMCFTGSEPNVAGLWLYVNVPDYSLSNEEERIKHIFHQYIQYAINLHTWFDGFNFRPKKRSLRNKGGATATYPEVVFTLANTTGWFNDGNQVFGNGNFNNITCLSGGERVRYVCKGLKYEQPINLGDNCNIDYIRKYKDKLFSLTLYLPLMPIKLWYKIPLSSKKIVGHTTIVMYIFIQYRVKKKRGFFGMLIGMVMIVVGTALTAFGYGAIGVPMVQSGGLALAGQVAMGIFGPKVGGFIALTIAIYSGYANISSGLAQDGMIGGMQVASGAVGITTSAMNYATNLKTMSAMNNLNKDLNSINSSLENENKKLLENQLRGVNLHMYDVKVNFDEEMDWIYYLAYGGLLYNDFYNDLAYNSMYKKYEEFDRFMN